MIIICNKKSLLQVIILNTNNLYTITWFEEFLLNINNFQTSIWPIDETLTATTTPSQCGPGSNDSEGVLYTL